ncbi:MAG: Asp-tRNA(Asn)/Glu-tRNA(Gln) amidotransferase subunit GatC [Hyphomicrobiaceae bacterium]|nr:Asp-tRNA(Asn)/Glu-tRNA(Gln) amidotransferase subunit GatC [Hyphomicrobiaceae bacterium]
MKVDEALVRRIAHLARIKVEDADVEHLKGELTSILGFVDLLSEVDTDDVEPMTSAVDRCMKPRPDVVNDGGYADDIVGNAPVKDDHYFMVPKVVE